MDTWIEWKASRRWEIVADEDADRILALVHEGSDRPDDFTVHPRGSDPSLLADLRGRRFASLDVIASAVADHLGGSCRIR